MGYGSRASNSHSVSVIRWSAGTAYSDDRLQHCTSRHTTARGFLTFWASASAELMEEVMEAITHENMVTPVTYQHSATRATHQSTQRAHRNQSSGSQAPLAVLPASIHTIVRKA